MRCRNLKSERRSMSDTPETDLEDDLFVDCDNPRFQCPAVKESTGAHLTCDFVPAEFARRLERERNHLLAALEGMVLLFEGQSGTGADYWEQYAEYKAAKAAISKAKGEA
jgi:hypothetical protein